MIILIGYVECTRARITYNTGRIEKLVVGWAKTACEYIRVRVYLA
jgi:hypothetical protein